MHPNPAKKENHQPIIDKNRPFVNNTYKEVHSAIKAWSRDIQIADIIINIPGRDLQKQEQRQGVRPRVEAAGAGRGGLRPIRGLLAKLLVSSVATPHRSWVPNNYGHNSITNPVTLSICVS